MMKKKMLAVVLAVSVVGSTVALPVCGAEFSSVTESEESFWTGEDSTESTDAEDPVMSEEISDVPEEDEITAEEIPGAPEEEQEEFTAPEEEKGEPSAENLTDAAAEAGDDDEDSQIEILEAPYKTEYMYGIEARQASDFDLRGLKIRVTNFDGETEDLTLTAYDEPFLEDSDANMYMCSIWKGNTELEWNEDGEVSKPLAVGEYTLRITDRNDSDNTASVKLTIVPVSDTLLVLNSSGAGKYSRKVKVSGKYACAKFIPENSGTYTFTSNTSGFDWGNGYRFNLYDAKYSPVSRITSENYSGMGMSKYKVKKGAVYYLSYKLYETDQVTSLNYKVEQVQSITSVKIVEKPYSKNYYIWGNSGIKWNSGKYRLYEKYGGKVKVIYSNGQTETLPTYAENKYGQALIPYVKSSGKGGYGTYDLYFSYEGSNVEAKISKGAILKKVSASPTLKGSGTITTSVSKSDESSAQADALRFVTGNATRYEITAKPLTFMTFVYEVSDGKTQWAGTLGGGKGIKVLKPNSVYYIAAQGSRMDVDKETFTIKPKSAKISGCTVTLSKTSCSYTGKTLKPAVTVSDGNSYLTEGTDYTLSYSNNKNPGTAVVTIKGKGSYTGSIKKTFKIKVAGCTLKSVKKSGISNVQLNWSNTSGVYGYYVYRASSKNGKYSKIATITSAKTVKYTDKKAASGKTWYYKVVPYAKINGKAVAGSSSKILSIRL